jgi:flagellar biosynthesis protein FlhF
MMQKTFFAEDMRQALRLVRDDMGAEAIILANKKVPGGVEVAAAIPGESQTTLRPIKTTNKAPVKAGAVLSSPVIADSGFVQTRTQESEFSAVQHALDSRAQRQVREMRVMASANGGDRINVENSGDEYGQRRQSAYDYYNSAQQPNNAQQPASASLARSDTKMPTAQPTEKLHTPIPAPIKTEENVITEYVSDLSSRYENEISLVKKQLNDLKEQLQKSKQEHNPLHHKMLTELQSKFLALGFSATSSEMIAHEVQDTSSSAGAWRSALSVLANKTLCQPDEFSKQFGCYTFIGSPGAGKTTLITKLAIEHIKKFGKDDLILVSLDNQRLGASYQITQLAHLLQVPVFVGDKGERILHKIDAIARNKKILVDTAGVTSLDNYWLVQMHLIKRLSELNKNIIVMPCTQQLSVLDHMINDYLLLDVVGTVLTKADEATSIAEVMSVSIENKLPILAINNSQKSSDPLLKIKGGDLIEIMMNKSRRRSAADDFMSFHAAKNNHKRALCENSLADMHSSNSVAQAMADLYMD